MIANVKPRLCKMDFRGSLATVTTDPRSRHYERTFHAQVCVMGHPFNVNFRRVPGQSRQVHGH